MTGVVHLLQHWGEAAPPSDLRTAGRMPGGARAGLAVALAAATLGAGFLVLVLWTTDTPGWWFSLLFSVFIVGLVIGLWAVYVGSIREGEVRAAAQARWAAALGDVRHEDGTVVARDVKTLEDGSVARFEVTVSTAAGDSVGGTWTRRSASAVSLLQPQVPGAGAAARVWRAPGSPVVIEVLDPSAVPGNPDLPKYV